MNDFASEDLAIYYWVGTSGKMNDGSKIEHDDCVLLLVLSESCVCAPRFYTVICIDVVYSLLGTFAHFI